MKNGSCPYYVISSKHENYCKNPHKKAFEELERWSKERFGLADGTALREKIQELKKGAEGWRGE